MINTSTVSALGDELAKIAFLGAMGKAVSRGWHFPSGMWTKTMQGGKPAWEAAEKATFMGKGKFTKNLPIGDKSITTAITAAALPGALKKEDPMGEGRSRLERLSGLAGSTLGGFAGSGAMSSLPMKKLPVARSIVGAIGGSMLGERLSTAPFRAARAKAEMPVLSDEQRAQLMSRSGVAG